MGIRWGHSSGYLSLGIDMWYSGDPNSGSVTITAVYYVRADGYGHDFNSTLRFSGETSGARGYSFYSPTGGNTVQEVHRVSWIKSTAYGSAVTATSGFTTDTIWNGGKPSASASIQIPARAYQTPAAPTGVNARRESDSQITVSWSQSTSAAAPVTAFGIERKSVSDPVWRKVGGASGSARSFTDTSVRANERYTYRVWAANGRASGKTESPFVSTTPSAPVNVRATKTSNGSIEVLWDSTSTYPVSRFTIFDNGIQVGQVSAASSWLHSQPSTSQTHTYTVRAEEDSLVSTLSAESNRVQLQAPPNAPKLQGYAHPIEPGEITFAWIHTPVDSSVQTSAKLRYRHLNSSQWIEVPIRGDANSHKLTLSAGVYEWQAQTWGAYKAGQLAGASPWSASDYLNLSDKPTVTISNVAEIVKVAFLEVRWGYFQKQQVRQAGVEVELLREGSTLLERQTVEGDLSELTLKTKLTDSGHYELRVRVKSAFSLYSEWQIQQFRVSFPLPPQPSLLLSWSDEIGAAQLTVVNPAPTGKQANTVYNQIHRSVDAGQTWELVADRVDVGGSILDPECLSHGQTLYKVTAVTLQDAAAESQETPLVAASQAIWLSGGSGFQIAVPLEYNPLHSTRVGLVNRKVHHFAGRQKGVELSGIQTEYQINISAALFDENAEYLERLKELAYQPAPFIYRDPTGRRIYCSLSHIDMSRALTGLWTVKTQIEEIDRD